MRCPRAHALVCFLLVCLALGADTAGAQRLRPVGARPIPQRSLPPFAALEADERATRRGPVTAVLLTRVVPSDGTWLAVERFGGLAQEGDRPSLWKHLVVGTLAGAAFGFTAGFVGYVLLCEGDCTLAFIGVPLSTGLGAGAGLLVGGVVYVWKRTRS